MDGCFLQMHFHIFLSMILFSIFQHQVYASVEVTTQYYHGDNGMLEEEERSDGNTAKWLAQLEETHRSDLVAQTVRLAGGGLLSRICSKTKMYLK